MFFTIRESILISKMPNAKTISAPTSVLTEKGKHRVRNTRNQNLQIHTYNSTYFNP